MDGNKTCSKCAGEMKKGRLYTPKVVTAESEHFFEYVNWEATDEKRFGGLFAYKCENCGFIDFYVESKARKK
jgi:hypothetical protein